jgi:tRNA(Ile)-lysidine synthase
VVHVATFDPGTGAAAAEAAALVAAEGARLGLPVECGAASLAHASEAEWRSARWRFLRAVAARMGAVIATAHTRDDQLETVVMRALRGAGARGLAGLAAPTRGLVRPLLDISRARVRDYARARRVPFIDDPSNASAAHLRNRVRHDLLPAIARLRPRFGDEMLDLARRAAEWREDVEALAARFVLDPEGQWGFRVARAELATYDSAALRVLWPAIAARAGLTLDRRGTLRLAQFTTSGATGARIQLSGGIEVLRVRDAFTLRRLALPNRVSGKVPLSGPLRFGDWCFSPAGAPPPRSTVTRATRAMARGGAPTGRDDEWTAEFAPDDLLWVREWLPGDRMRLAAGGSARRVKRFLADARVPGPSRAGWPVVLLEDEIVWIPGVRRSDAASERSGRPTVRYVCERFEAGPPAT